MKILFFTPWYPTNSNPVPGVFILEHARSVALQHEVLVAATSVEIDRPDGWIEETEEIYCGLQTVRFSQGRGSIPKARYLSRLYRETRFLERLVKRFQPDIIHANNFLAAVPAALIKRKYKVPFVVSEHWSGFYRGTVKGAELLKARFGLPRADRVLPVSQYLADRITAHNIKANITVVPNAIDTELFRYKPHTMSREPIASLRALAVGSLLPIKGMDLLVEAADRLRSGGSKLEIMIVGEGEERGRLERRIRDLGLEAQVKLPGILRKPELAALMQQSDFFISPSRGETFAVALVEAMATGLPAVATDVGATPEVMNETRGILVAPEDPEALASGIREMIAKKGAFDRQAISDWARGKFGLEIVGEQFDRIYREVLRK